MTIIYIDRKVIGGNLAGQFGLGYENLKLYIAQYIPTCQLDSSKAMIHVETVEFFTICANWLKRHLLLL